MVVAVRDGRRFVVVAVTGVAVAAHRGAEPRPRVVERKLCTVGAHGGQSVTGGVRRPGPRSCA